MWWGGEHPLFLMVWLSPEQNEIMHLRSQQKSVHDDNDSALRQLEVRQGREGGEWESLLSTRLTCQMISGGVSYLSRDCLLAWVTS